MAVVTLVISVALLFVSYRTLSVYNVLEEKTEMATKGQEDAREMQEASDYLTEQVRCFVETGEKQYLDAYFEESDVTRRRDNAVKDLGEMFAGTTEFEALQQAGRQSVILMDTEYHAMRLVVEAYGYDLSEYPEVIRKTALSREDAALSPEEKLMKARQLVFDDNYHLQKTIISAKTHECLNDLLGELQDHQVETANQFGFIIRVEQALIIALILMVIIIVTLTTWQVIGPLVRAIPRIRDDKPLPVNGAEEFRYLANTYNKMYEENKSQKEELAYEASHDQLTGVFNRKGFEKVMEDVNHTRIAILLIDVDRFKQINDTYGHAEGDKLLSHLTGILGVNFRTGDMLCRVGGDEFVMFLPGVGPEHRDRIEAKIREINQILTRGSGDVPPTSISVGVAFGENEDAMEVYKKADIALYRVKENGRCGVDFFE